MLRPFLTLLFAVSISLAHAQEAPEKVVQKQLDAYNAQNVEAFVATYADSVKLYQWPARQIMAGKEQLRKNYGEMFRRSPDNYAALVGRIVQGNFVIDREKVTGTRSGSPYETYATAIYEVRNGLIVNVWFLR